MAKVNKHAPAKYTDKSAGQPELLPVFDAVKKLVSAYAKENYAVKTDSPRTMSCTMIRLWECRENTTRK